MYPRILQKIDNFLVRSTYRYANRRWYSSPLLKKPIGTKEEYLTIADDAKKQNYPVINDIENELNYSVDNEWFHTLALRTQVVKKKSEIVYQHGRLLYAILSDYVKTNSLGYVNIIETGTARGFSSLCMAKALDDIKVNGKIFTFDVLPHYHKMYWNCIADLEGKMTRSDLLKDYHELSNKYIAFIQGSTITEMHKLQMERVHFAFLDGGHDYYHVIREFNNIKEVQEKGDIIFFDDYTPKLFPGVVKAVDDICEKNNYKKRIIEISSQRAYAFAIKN